MQMEIFSANKSRPQNDCSITHLARLTRNSETKEPTVRGITVFAALTHLLAITSAMHSALFTDKKAAQNLFLRAKLPIQESAVVASITHFCEEFSEISHDLF